MPKGMQAIYTQVVGAGGSAGITFNNIPQTYTDLKLVVSARASYAATRIYLGLRLNGATSLYNNTVLSGGGSSTSSGRNYTGNGEIYIGEINATNSVANTFSNTEINIPYYTTSMFKSINSDSVYENTITEAFLVFCSGLSSSNAPVTSLSVYPGGGNNFNQYSTFTLYGIAR